MVDEKTCAWVVVWKNDGGFTDFECHLLPESAQAAYDRIKKEGITKIVMLAAIKEWFIR